MADSTISLRVSPEMITRMPTWCLDVMQREQRMRERGISVESEHARAAAPETPREARAAAPETPREARPDVRMHSAHADTVVDAEDEEGRESSTPWTCPSCHHSNFQ